MLGETVEQEGGYINVYLDPKISIESGELERILDYLHSCSLQIADYGNLVEQIEAAIPGREIICG